MEKQEIPAWLETLWNVNPRLAEAAKKDVERWQKLETRQDKALNLADVVCSALECNYKLLKNKTMDLITYEIQKEMAKYDESVQVYNGKDGYKVYHNGIEVYFAHHLNDGAKEEANREATCLINKLKQQNKTVYVYLQ